MTERITKPRARRKREINQSSIPVRAKSPEIKKVGRHEDAAVPETQKTVLDIPLLNPLLSADRRYPTSMELAVTAIRYQYRPPALIQPSQIIPEALDTAFISHYVQVNTESHSPDVLWLNYLPHLHAGTTKFAVKCCLRAVSMAFFGKLHRDPSILVDSWRWYTSSLNAHHTSYAKLKDDQKPADDDLYIPLLLAFYGIYVGTTSSHAVEHLTAVAKLLYLAGPAKCTKGPAWTIFQAMRPGAVSPWLLAVGIIKADFCRLIKRSVWDKFHRIHR